MIKIKIKLQSDWTSIRIGNNSGWGIPIENHMIFHNLTNLAIYGLAGTSTEARIMKIDIQRAIRGAI